MKTIKYLSIVCLIFYPLFIQGVSYNEEFLVNTYTEGRQSGQNIAALTNGTFVVCWSGTGQNGYGIYGQLFSASADKIGQEFQVNTSNPDRGISMPCTAGLADGKFVVCWAGEDQDNFGINGQLFTSSGGLIGQEFQVNTYTTRNQESPSITNLADSKFVVCWQSSGQDGSGWGIYGQLFTSSAERIGQEFQVNTYTNEFQKEPSVTCLTNNTFVVCWASEGQDGSGYGIYGQIFAASGERIGQEFQMNTYTNHTQWGPSLTSLTDGKFVVCWESMDQDGWGYDIYGQVFANSGECIGNEFQVNTYSKGNYNPCVTGLVDGKFIIFWSSDNNDSFAKGIFAQLFDASAERIGHEFRVKSFTTTDPFYCHPRTSGLTDGKFVICWGSNNTDFFYTTGDIFGKYYLPDSIVHELTDFELIEPQYDATLEITNPIFTWEQASPVHINFPWELTYDLYLDIDANFTNPQIKTAIYDTSFQIDALSPGQTYFWKVLAKNIAGDSLWSSNTNGFFVSYDARPNDLEENETILHEEFGLEQNYPNPFNPTTTIPVILPNRSKISITVYNTLGQKVATVANNQSYSAGRHEFSFNGSTLASGVYIINTQIISEDKKPYHFSKKMLLLR